MKISELKKVMKEYCDAYPKIREDKHIEFQFRLAPKCLIIDKFYKDNYDGNVIKIYTHNDSYVISINQELLPTSKEFKKLYNAILEYIDTPIKEREDEKYWYIHLLTGKTGYLNYLEKEKYYVANNEEEYIGYKPKFTKHEIAKYLDTDDDAFINSFIKRFGEEVK